MRLGAKDQKNIPRTVLNSIFFLNVELYPLFSFIHSKLISPRNIFTTFPQCFIIHHSAIISKIINSIQSTQNMRCRTKCRNPQNESEKIGPPQTSPLPQIQKKAKLLCQMNSSENIIELLHLF